MCGICGFVGSGDKNILARMMTAMPHRGPDDVGHWHDGHDLYLGHLRLSIVDLTDGCQPMVSIDKSLVLVFNGEIYNHRDLRRELEAKGHVFQTAGSDTEVILHGYREWGKEVVHKLNGMWAFVLFDKKNDVLWLSRDRFGKKPLYYALIGDTFLFASELTSLILHPAVKPRIDELSLIKYFAYGYVPAPRTMLAGIHKMPAGHHGVFSLRQRRLRIDRYWRYQTKPDEAWLGHEHELGQLLVERLSNAVALRMQADVPVGLFLSGGIDSSAISALAAKHRDGDKINSFSVGFHQKSFDEEEYFSRVAKLTNTRHRAESLSVAKCIELIPSIYGRLDEPMADSSLIPTFLLCQLASQDITVALSGDGSDELLAGYDPIKALGPAAFYSQWMPKTLHGYLSNLINKLPVSHSNMSVDFKLKKFLSGIAYNSNVRSPIWLSALPPPHLAKLFGKEIPIEEVYSESIEAWEASRTNNLIDHTLQFYIELYLQNGILTKIDRASMLNSIEVRSPFLDFDFVDLIATIPAQQKFKYGQTKYILKKALAPVLPKNIRYRPKKGLGVPIGQWFKDSAIEINSDRFGGLLDTNLVRKLEKEHVEGRADWRAFLWSHFVLEQWAVGSLSPESIG